MSVSSSQTALSNCDSAEDSLPIANEVLEQPEFLSSQFDGAIPAADGVRIDIDFQIATCEHHSVMRLLSSQEGADPCHELLVGEGLDEVVVGTAVEPVNAVGDPIPGRQHEDGKVAGCPDHAADLDAVHARQHQIEHHQVGRAMSCEVEGGEPVAGRRDLMPLITQGSLQRSGQKRIVLDDQYRARQPGHVSG